MQQQQQLQRNERYSLFSCCYTCLLLVKLFEIFLAWKFHFDSIYYINIILKIKHFRRFYLQSALNAIKFPERRKQVSFSFSMYHKHKMKKKKLIFSSYFSSYLIKHRRHRITKLSITHKNVQNYTWEGGGLLLKKPKRKQKLMLEIIRGQNIESIIIERY